MNIWMDSLTVLVNQARAVFGILIMVIWGQVLIVALFKKIFKNQFTNAEYFSLGMAGWILPSALLSILLLAGIFLFGEIAATVISVFALVAPFYILFIWKLGRTWLWAGSGLALLFAVSVILRLAFLKKVILPMYFDSAEHYRIIKYLLSYFELPGSDLSLKNYYHVGYHFLSAAISHIFHIGVVDTMLVFGQVILAILPFSLFFIVKQETVSNSAAIFTCLLAGFGWHMPAHAINWGKYPALFSLVGIHFVLSIGYLIYRNNKFKSERLLLYLLLGFGVLISTLIHTRSLIIFAFMGISLLLTYWRGRLSLVPQRFIFAFVLCVLALQIVFVQGNSALAPLFGAYIGQDLLVTGLVILLFIFSAQAFADLTFFLLIVLSMMLAGLFIPISGISNYGTLALLDRPYVQMLFYLPLSIFGGLGLAGLLQYLSRFAVHLNLVTPALACGASVARAFLFLPEAISVRLLKLLPRRSPKAAARNDESNPKLLTWLVTLLTISYVILSAAANHNFYPSDCCQIVNRDDLAALEWIDKTLPSDANVLISSTDLFVNSFDITEPQAGVDGGVWITPLTSRKTIFMKGDLNFDQAEVHAEICAQNIGYIYVGGMPLSFDDLQLDEQPDWYQSAFSLPQAKVYRVIGCGYNTHGHKLRFPPLEKAQFVTECGIVFCKQ